MKCYIASCSITLAILYLMGILQVTKVDGDWRADLVFKKGSKIDLAKPIQYRDYQPTHKEIIVSTYSLGTGMTTAPATVERSPYGFNASKTRKE